MAPENSLAGLEVAARQGFRAVEFDVMLSADRVPVVIHDETLDRTCNASGPVAAHSLVELQRMRCNKGWPGRFDDQTIPGLEQVLTRCHDLGLLPNVEIKPSAGADVLTGEIVAAECRAIWRRLGGPGAAILLSSFSVDALQAARVVAPELSRAWLVGRIPDDWPSHLAALAADAIHCSGRDIAPASLTELKRAQVPVRCYTVNDPAQAGELFAQGVAAVFTDALQKFSPSR